MSKEPKEATLVEIRSDGAQRYEARDGSTIWLTGRNRTSGVQVGDTGKLEYRTSPSSGLWFFIPDSQERP